MKLVQFNGCKTLLALIVIIFVSLIYYYNPLNFFGQRFNDIGSIQISSNRTKNEETTPKRIKRFLIFQGTGVVKFVFGTSFPIIMADKKRSLNYFYNYQLQYSPPTMPLYWWSAFNTTTFEARKNLRKRSLKNVMHFDKSRAMIYEFIETILERSGYIGKDCLLKIICELARAPLNEDENKITALNTHDNEEYTILEDYDLRVQMWMIVIFMREEPAKMEQIVTKLLESAIL